VGVRARIVPVLAFGKDKTEHDNRLAAVLPTLQSAGVMLNRDKCLFDQDRLTFLGHVVDKNGISTDPDKITALTKIKSPDSVSGLRQFLGIANQLGKFTPNHQILYNGYKCGMLMMHLLMVSFLTYWTGLS